MSVGGKLASARAARGLDLAEVSERTRVRAQLLRAIEADDYSGCGGDVYARGHLRAFAAVVGLDAAPLLEEYDRDHALPVEPALPSGATTDATVDLSPRGIRDPRRLSWTGVGVVAAAVVAVVAVVAYAAGGSGTAPSPRTALQAPSPAASTAAPSTVAPSQVPSQLPSGVHVVVTAVSGDSWVGLLPSYKVQVTLQKGQTKEFDDASQIDLRIGNPRVVKLVVNGQVVPVSGSTTPVDRTFTAGGATSASETSPLPSGFVRSPAAALAVTQN